MIRAIRLHWDDERGWLLDVPFLLPRSHIVSLIQRKFLPLQIDRFRSLPHSDAREHLKNAIESLKRYEVEQLLVGPHGNGKGDLVVLDAPRPGGYQQFSIGTGTASCTGRA